MPEMLECHLRSALLHGLRPEITQAVKINCLEWNDVWLTVILKHTMHAEELQSVKRERTKTKADKDLQLAFMKAMTGAGSSKRNGKEASGHQIREVNIN
ncbi:hypothetical protein QQF64_012024 [Cirrhinus molitorella]|uniref:Uncharacterized protein n=1 Tax=Cirrhinus molitorella TaxID=172907 RepID=A0ABR3LXH1_9TELE